jgi:hypothetical protein
MPPAASALPTKLPKKKPTKIAAPGSKSNKTVHTRELAVESFTEHALLWERFVASGQSNPGMRAILVGPGEGFRLCALWMLERVLAHPTSHLTILENPDRAWTPLVRETFMQHGIAHHAARVKMANPAPETISVALMRIALEKGAARHDLVCVDNTADSSRALEHAVLAFRLVRPGGVLVLTNYTHSLDRDARCPRRGIDAFLDAYAYDASVMRTAWHVFVKRRETPLAAPPCHSEYFDPPSLPSRRRNTT